MRYRKKGLIFVPSGELWWARKYATIPTALVLKNCIRIWFASLDEFNYGRIGFIDVDLNDPGKILRLHPHPVLNLGDIGTFDDSGVNASCVIRMDGRWWMYYIGWQRCERVPYMLFAGLAVSEDLTTFTRIQRVPILERTDAEPFSRSAPFVMHDGTTWHMWYWSCEHWSVDHGLLHYNNVIRHATSADGVRWVSEPPICIVPREPDEYSVGRPWVIRDSDGYHMWFSARSFSKRYAISYAHSADGREWKRVADDVVPTSDEGWDSDMVCYPCVVETDAVRYVFYNGNRHGLSGFGYAVIDR